MLRRWLAIGLAASFSLGCDLPLDGLGEPREVSPGPGDAADRDAYVAPDGGSMVKDASSSSIDAHPPVKGLPDSAPPADASGDAGGEGGDEGGLGGGGDLHFGAGY